MEDNFSLSSVSGTIGRPPGNTRAHADEWMWPHAASERDDGTPEEPPTTGTKGPLCEGCRCGSSSSD
ncbi:Hypothetical protein SMAX5B_020530, partial [Scophthalmus maximus]